MQEEYSNAYFDLKSGYCIPRRAHPYFLSKKFSLAADHSPRVIYHLPLSASFHCAAMSCVAFREKV